MRVGTPEHESELTGAGRPAATGAGAAGAAAAGPGVGRAFAVYTGLRALLFVGVFGLLLLAGLRGLPALLGALLVSSVASVFVLRGARDRATAALAARQESRAAEHARLRGMLDD